MGTAKSRIPRAERGMPEAQLYEIFADFPRPVYPFPDITPGYFERLRRDADRWIEEECLFNSPEDRERYKRHHFTDIAARS